MSGAQSSGCFMGLSVVHASNPQSGFAVCYLVYTLQAGEKNNHRYVTGFHVCYASMSKQILIVTHQAVLGFNS